MITNCPNSGQSEGDIFPFSFLSWNVTRCDNKLARRKTFASSKFCWPTTRADENDKNGRWIWDIYIESEGMKKRFLAPHPIRRYPIPSRPLITPQCYILLGCRFVRIRIRIRLTMMKMMMMMMMLMMATTMMRSTKEWMKDLSIPFTGNRTRPGVKSHLIHAHHHASQNI